MRIARKYALAVFVLLLLIGFLLSYRSFLMTTIVEPIAMLGWVAWRIVISVDQSIYWMLLLIICSIIFVHFAFSGKGPLPKSAYQDSSSVPGRLEFWRQLIEQAALGNSERAALQEKITQLYVDGLGEQAALEQAAHPRLQEWVILPGQERRSFSILPGLNTIFPAPKWLRRWLNHILPPDYTLIDEILTRVERELEITYEE
jgi:hypothetical protein